MGTISAMAEEASVMVLVHIDIKTTMATSCIIWCLTRLRLSPPMADMTELINIMLRRLKHKSNTDIQTQVHSAEMPRIMPSAYLMDLLIQIVSLGVVSTSFKWSHMILSLSDRRWRILTNHKAKPLPLLKTEIYFKLFRIIWSEWKKLIWNYNNI